jgi:hypothetical protein
LIGDEFGKIIEISFTEYENCWTLEFGTEKGFCIFYYDEKNNKFNKICGIILDGGIKHAKLLFPPKIEENENKVNNENNSNNENKLNNENNKINNENNKSNNKLNDSANNLNNFNNINNYFLENIVILKWWYKPSFSKSQLIFFDFKQEKAITRKFDYFF